ncbi:MAG: DUF2723 domain-containing protein [Ignavibacteriales bacterium]|nr:DUF2723 domain-containing protein [Ignavibacteriales bacterium]MCF8305816.1 DUF2723 domain-containing protein [Ignavibacteriales bacterium]MCF8315538.1 DUF2723 domain-containing protein [Ignavibacteriales bacterium]MCF8436932.1 DUF2723 domain-containing protein [Ignavibacteriales bacterium]
MRNIFIKYLPYFFFFVAAFVYSLTLAPSLVEIDSGELAAVQFLPGIAHPSGYPLFTLIGHLFTKLPFPVRTITLGNIQAMIYTLGGIIFFYVTLLRIYRGSISEDTIAQNGKVKKPAKKKPAAVKNHQLPGLDVISLLFIAASGMLAFSLTVWRQSTSIEVYSLHFLLLNTILFFSVRAYFSSEVKTKFINNDWVLVFLIMGLSFANHLTTILIFPGIVFLYLKKTGITGSSIKRLIISGIPGFLLMLLFYLYLPITASANPALNWGNPVDFERIFRHVSGKQYQVWMFSSLDAAFKQLWYFLSRLPLEFGYIGIIPVVLGFFKAFRVQKSISVFVLINLLVTVFYSINYDIHDIDSYFLLSFISLTYFAFWGLFFIFELIKDSGRQSQFFTFSLIFVITPLVINFSKADRSEVYIFEDYTKSILASLPQNSIVLTYQWDYFISPAYYLQNVENIREDVVIIDKELLRRSWYFTQLSNSYPDVMRGIIKEKKLFLEALKPFERGDNYNPGILEKYYRAIMTNLISSNITARNIFIAPELVDNEMRKGELQLPGGFSIVPYGFLYKVVPDNSNYIPYTSGLPVIRIPSKTDSYIENIKLFTFSMFSSRALYENAYEETDNARKIIDWLKEYFPEKSLHPELMGIK